LTALRYTDNNNIDIVLLHGKKPQEFSDIDEFVRHLNEEHKSIFVHLNVCMRMIKASASRYNSKRRVDRASPLFLS